VWIKISTHEFFFYFYFIVQSVYYCLFKKIDVIYSTAFGSLSGSMIDIIIFKLAKILNIKIIVHFQGSNFKKLIEEDANPIHRYILRTTYKKIDGAIVLCESMREQINFLIDDRKITVISNFYDPILEGISTEDISNKETNPVIIGYFSNLVYSKGIVHLLEAFKELSQSNRPTNDGKPQLWIAGNIMGDEYMSAIELRNVLDNYVRENPDIKYFGVLTHEKKRDFFKKINIFALPTFYRHEAQPLSLFEAMRAGCVVISTQYKYIPDFINDNNGYLVQVKSKEALSERLDFLIKNPSIIKKFSDFNFRFSLENYSVEKYQDSVNKIIENII
jgi:glycosyltransferase involved in cell wall biosynthesis